MPRPIKWSGIKDPSDYDLSTKRPSGTWDVMWNGRDGWVIKPPLYWKTLDERHKVVVGFVDRETARLRAEALIQADEKR